MNKKNLLLFFIFFIGFISLFSIFVSQSYAQSAMYCIDYYTSCTSWFGTPCTRGSTGCTCSQLCSQWQYSNRGCLPGRPCALCAGDEVCDGGGGTSPSQNIYTYQYQYQYQYQSQGSVYYSQYGYQGQYGYQAQYGYEYQYQGEYSYQYQVQPNLDVTGISFYDNDGNQRTTRQFHPLEPIYLRTSITNSGQAYPCCSSRTSVYRSRGSSAPVGAASDIPMYIDSSSNWPPGFTAVYESWPGGVRSNQFTRNSFTVFAPGTYTARVFTDYDNRIGEETSADNQATSTYTILPPDLVIDDFTLLDEWGFAHGSSSDPFFTIDDIYPRVIFRNQGTGRASSNDGFTDSAIYAHSSTQPSVNQTPNPGLLMVNGIFNVGYQNEYGPPPIGPNSWAFTPPNYSWTRPTPGTYRSWAVVNYNREASESNYTNNYSSVAYVVEIPYSIEGRVYLDNDQSGSYNTGDLPLGGITVTLSGTPSNKEPVVTNANGQYQITRIRAGTYTVAVDLPDNARVFNNGGSPSRTYTLGPDRTGADFGLIGRYTVSGKVFVDDNLSGTQDGGESDYPGTPNLSVSAKPPGSPNPYILSNTNGTYQISGIIGRDSWTQKNSFTGFSGSGYMTSDIDTGRYYSALGAGVPSVNYQVNFQTPGTYYVWVRGYGAHGGADSLHIGVNGSNVSTSDSIRIANSGTYYGLRTWGWSNDTMDGPIATLSVPSAGVRTINMGMREDGTYVDKLVLTTDPDFDPVTSGVGPAQSSFSGGTYTESGGQVVIEAETFTTNTDIGGNYTVSLTLPAGYYATNPLPPLFNLTMSGTCPPLAWNTSTGATCTNGNIDNLNFGINPASSWFQSRGGDLRFDQGFSDAIPSSPAPACTGPVASRTGPDSSTPGVVFSGNRLPVFGSGVASTSDWRVGNAQYPEIYNPVNPTTLRTSYDYVDSSARQQGETFTNLPCSYGSCTLSNLSSGYYRASNGDGSPVTLNLNSFSMEAEAQIVILVDGALRINTTIDVPDGASLTVIARDDITVSSSIGAVVTGGMACPTSGHIEGLFSTDDSFILESAASCSAVRDRMLSLEGAVVVSADLNGGIFQNNRTLCDLNVDYPSLVITERPDMILLMPEVLKVPTYTWREVAP